MKTSKLLSVIGAGSLLANVGNATLYNYSSSTGAAIPDGNYTGVTSSINVSGLNNTISDVNVNLNISGGYNGDLYGYLVDPSGNIAVLLNRVGSTSGNPYGYGNSGLNVTFDESSNRDIHNYQNLTPSYDLNGALIGTWQSDARNTNPNSVVNTDARNATLNSFNGYNGNGTWTLYLADLSGGNQANLTGWGMQISTIPELNPMVLAGSVVGVALGARAIGRYRNNRKK